MTMQYTGAVGRPRPQRQTEDDLPEWRYIKFDITTPIGYWTEDAEGIPPAARERVDRLLAYEDLYHGDFSAWLNLEERLVNKNWFSDISLLYADFMLAAKPVWYVGDQPLNGSGLLPETSLRAFGKITEQVVRDQATYGIGVVEVEVPDGDAEAAPVPKPRRVHPRLWFPTGDDDDVLAGPLDDDPKVFVVQHFASGGEITRQLYGLGDDGKLTAYSGEELPRRSQSIGSESAWEVIEELTDGRATPLILCPREPEEGGWGWRIYEGLARLIFEYNRRISSRSGSIDRHEDPIMIAIPEEESGEIGGRPQMGRSATEREQVRLGEVNTNLATWRKQKVGYLPQGIGRLEYLGFDGNYEASAIALEDIRKDIVSTARLPASLLGIDDLKLGSGVALRVSHSQTYLTLQNMQEALVEHLRRIMLIMAAAAGVEGDVIRAFNAELRVEWENPVDYLESGRPMVTTDDGGSDDMEDELLADEERIATALEELAEMSEMDRAAFQAEATAAMDRNQVSMRGRSIGRGQALSQRAMARQEMRMLRNV